MAKLQFTLSDKARTYLRRSLVFLTGLVLCVFLFRITFIQNAGADAQSLSFALGNNITSVYKTIFADKAKLKDERDFFQIQSQSISVDVVEMQAAQNRIRELERLLEYTQTVEGEYISSKVLSRSSGEKLLLDKGERDDVQLGSAIVVEDGHLLAIVTEVREQTSIATLLISPMASVTGAVAGRGRASGIVEGDNGFFLKMSLIPKTDSISKGELIVTAGLDQFITSNLILGIVEEINDQESDAFKSATLRPLIDFNTYSEVLILNQPK